jgi:hypothetical protein
MYPNEELSLLAARKAALRERISIRRDQCAAAAERASRPLAWVDRALARWRRVSPLVKIAAIPLAILLKRRLARRTRVFGAILRWGPVVFGAVRGLTAERTLAHRR